MFKCRDCEAVSTTYYDVCPECEGSIEEAKECQCCNEWFFPDELTDTTEYINGGLGDCCEGCIENGDMIEIGE